jgi:perosamine synthetase
VVKPIKIFDPVVSQKEEFAIKKVLKSHQWALGNGNGLVSKFEKKFNQLIGSSSCVAVDSGTSAINLALSAIDVKDKEVILPSLCYVSVAHAVVLNGGIPIFADIDPTTLCINVDSIKQKYSKKTKVIIPVHFAGMPCNLIDINKFSKKHNLQIIEDACLALGSTYNGKNIGTHNSFVCFSFHPVKNLAMPKGGAITLNKKNYSRLNKILKSKRWCGISDKTVLSDNVEEIGLNNYMNEFSAAIGLEQLKKLNSMIKKRKLIAKIYSEEIVLDTKMPFNKNCSYNFYWILTKNRNNLIKKLQENKIECGTYHTPIHTIRRYKNGKLPITEKISNELVCLPNHPNLDHKDVKKIINVVNQFSKFTFN